MPENNENLPSKREEEKETFKKVKGYVQKALEICDTNPAPYNAILEKAEELQKKYPEDFYKYGLYHALAFSTIKEDVPIEASDFPGSDSIEVFVQKIIAPLLPEEPKETKT